MKKHIVCFGDSNTHGYCADPTDCADGGNRFNEDERWTCLLQKKLGDEYLVIEEGLGGRTTVFDDALHESMSGLDVIYSVLMSHEPVDLLIIMLGTNDCKERFGANACCISIGMDRLIMKAKTTECWTNGVPNILVIAPPHMKEGFHDEAMGLCCIEKSKDIAKYYEPVCKNRGVAFLDADAVSEFNKVDFTHLTRQGHSNLADKLAETVPGLLK